MHQRRSSGFKSLPAKAGVWVVAILFLCSPCAWAKKPTGGGGSGGGSHGGGGSTKTSDIAVTSNVYNFNVSYEAYNVQSDQANAPFGSYSNDSTTNLTSVLMGNGNNGITDGDWRLDLASNTAGRSLNITLQPAQGQTVPPAGLTFSTFADMSHVQATCTLMDRDMLTMAAGDSFTCPLTIRLVTGATKSTFYRLEMQFYQDPNTNYALVTCNAVASDGSGWNDWFIDPDGQGVAQLTQLSTRGGKNGPVNEGDYYLKFHFHVTRP